MSFMCKLVSMLRCNSDPYKLSNCFLLPGEKLSLKMRTGKRTERGGSDRRPGLTFLTMRWRSTLSLRARRRRTELTLYYFYCCDFYKFTFILLYLLLSRHKFTEVSLRKSQQQVTILILRFVRRLWMELNRLKLHYKELWSYETVKSTKLVRTRIFVFQI